MRPNHIDRIRLDPLCVYNVLKTHKENMVVYN